MSSDREAKRKAAHNNLDRAICEYMESVNQPGIVTSWTMAVGTAVMENGEEFDGFRAASSQSISRWTAIGLLRIALKGAEEDGLIPTHYEDQGDADE